jgi:hypothetical protein
VTGKQARSDKQRPGDLQVRVPSSTNNRPSTQGRMTFVADPIVKKVWLTADSRTSLTRVRALLEYTSNLNLMSPNTLQLELNLSLSNIDPGNLGYLNQIISAAQHVDIGIEKTLPKVSICIPYRMASEPVVRALNELDIHNPRIELHISVQGSNMVSFFQSDGAVGLEELLHKYHIYSRVFLLLDLSKQSLRSLQDREVEQFLDLLKKTSVILYPPVV